MKANEIPDRQANTLRLYTKLMRATSAVTEMMHRHLDDHRLSISQFGVLEALYHLGPLCQKDIGRKILKTSGNITMVIDNLEKRELVRRERDPMDRRKVSVALTEHGHRLIERIFPDHAKIAFETFSILDPKEQNTLSVLLKKLGRAAKE